MKIQFLLFILIVVLLFSGCSLFADYDTLHVVLPDYSSDWSIRWNVGTGQVEERQINDSAGLDISIDREIPVVVAAYSVEPALPSSWNPKPAGYIAGPELLRQSSITLTWQDGFGAEILLELAAKHMDLREFNVSRFARTLRDVAIGGSPWNLNRRKLVSDLIEGEFWVYSTKSADSFNVVLSLPAGYWQPDYLGQKPFIVGNNGLNTTLVAGLHCFLRVEDGKVASVWVSAKNYPVLRFDG